MQTPPGPAKPTYDRRAIVTSLGVGQWYPQGIARMAQSLTEDRLEAAHAEASFYTTGYLGPSHSERPYAFKTAAIQQVRDSFGARLVLWCDSSCWFVDAPTAIFNHINEHGCYLLQDGWNVGQWCSDAALPLLGITREEAFSIPLLYAITIGLDLDRPNIRHLFHEWQNLALNTDAFKGPWTNEAQQASTDPRVLGHRHDQTALSVLAWRHGLPLIPAGKSHLECVPGGVDQPTRDGVVILARGM